MRVINRNNPLHLSLRSKVLLLAVLPLLLLTGVVWWLGNGIEAKSLQVRQVLEQKVPEKTKQELVYLMDMAFAVIDPVLKNKTLTEQQKQEEVKRIVREKLFFGKDDDGYFYVYDSNGVNLVHPTRFDFEGHNKLNDLPMIRELLEKSKQSGEGFANYVWERPSTQRPEYKLGYARMLNPWGWMIGTGLYDVHADINNELQQTSNNVWQTFHQVLWFMTGIILVIVLLTFSVNWHESRLADRYLRALVHNFVQLQVEERRGFARELHDGINQLMTAAKFSIELGLRQIRRGSEDYQGSLTKALDTLDDSINEVRRISHGLRPALLDNMGLSAALEGLAKSFEEHTGIRVVLVLDGANPPDDVAIMLYRVVQEALTNIERHAHASTVNLCLHQTLTEAQLELHDDGVGFDPESLPIDKGIGLKNMRERVELLGGYWHLHSKPGGGTHIRATLPFTFLSGS